jgi:hypothetical protein
MSEEQVPQLEAQIPAVITTTYKEKKCDICNKMFKINYFYTHLKCKKHAKLEAGKKLKEELLNDTATGEESKACVGMGDYVKETIDSLKAVIRRLESI